MTEHRTLVDPAWRLCSGRNRSGGILFLSYKTGIGRYTRVSEDGTLRLDLDGPTYRIQLLGYGWIKSDNSERAKRFRTADNAVKAALKIRDGK